MSSNQTTLNEITNKVFNELMQQKTDAQLQCLNGSQSTSMHTLQNLTQHKRLSDAEEMGGRSEEWCSESSSGQLRQPLIKGRTFVSANGHKKFSLATAAATAAVAVAPTTDISSKHLTENSSINDDASKKPLIAKWKTGVRIQNAAPTTTPDSKGKMIYKFFFSIKL